MEDHPIKFLTLNCWGLRVMSKLRRPRLRAIAEKLATTDHDIVALQEVWVEEDWAYIEEQCKDVFPYRRFFKSGIITGPGLALLSKWPIQSSFLYRFPINGRPTAVRRGDWYAGKSIAVTVLQPHAPGARQLAVLNSHMHASYEVEGDASYSTHRACQAWDLAKVVNVLQKAGYAVVQVGDLNSEPGSLPYKLFTLEGGLSDSWELLHGDKILSNDEISLLSPHDQITKGGITYDSQLNTWTKTRKPWEVYRLDYALIDRRSLVPLSAEVQFTELLEAPYACSYSDHFAYSVTLALKDKPSTEVSGTIAELVDLYADTLGEIQEYLDHTIPFQSNWRKYHFYASLGVVVLLFGGIYIFASESPLLAVILAFLSVIIGITGYLNGMVAFMSVRSEKRALLEVKMQVEDSLRAARAELSLI